MDFKKKNIFYLINFIVILMGMFLVWYSTNQFGGGLISDTYQYVSAAKSFAAGNGFKIPYGSNEFLPLTKYPPFLSLLLSSFEVLGINSFVGAIYLNVFLLGISTFTLSLYINKLTNSYFYSIIASMIFVFSPVMIELHSWILSEPLYLFLSILIYLILHYYFEEKNKKYLLLASFLSACLLLTRYVGFSLVAAILLILFFVQNKSWKQRFFDSLVFGAISSTPAILWTIRSILLTGTLNDRSINFHPLSKMHLVTAIGNILKWFFPEKLVLGNEKFFLLIGGITVCTLIIFTFFKLRRITFSIGDYGSLFLHVMYIFTYGSMIIISKTWFDDAIGMSDRIFSPLYISLITLILYGLSILPKIFGRSTFFAGLVISVLLVLYNIVGGGGQLKNYIKVERASFIVVGIIQR